MLDGINHDILFALYGLSSSSSFATDTAIFFATWFPILVIASVIVYEYFTQEHEHEILRTILRTALPSFVIWVIVFLIKYFFPTPRPFAGDLGIIPLISVSDPYGSFPSAHAAVFGALAGTMIANKFHAWKWYLFAAICIALARVGVGVHWPSDVLVGITFGLLGGFILSRFVFQTKK